MVRRSVGVKQAGFRAYGFQLHSELKAWSPKDLRQEPSAHFLYPEAVMNNLPPDALNLARWKRSV